MATRTTTVEITMPPMGESVTEGTVLEWRKQVGDHVEADEPLVEISTDKVDGEVPAPVAGTLTRILVEADDTVTVGTVLGEIEADGDAGATGVVQPPARAGATRPERGAGDGGAPPPAAEFVDVEFPAMGESVTEGTVIEWRRQVGERVEVDEPLVEISTDKVDGEVPAPVAGTVAEILAEADATVAVGTVLCRIAAGADAPAGPVQPAARLTEERRTAVAPADGEANATPVAARIAAAHGLEVGALRGSGPRERVTKADVLAVLEGDGAAAGAATPAAHEVAARVPGADEPVGPPPAPAAAAAAAPLSAAPATPRARVSPLRGPAATLARFMNESRSIPTATSFRTVPVDVLDERRRALKAAGRRLSYTHLVAWAIVQAAARDWPVMAHSYAERDGAPQRVDPGGVSLGLAVDVERRDGTRSLTVPVVRDAHALSFPDFTARYDELVAGARDNSLPPEAYQGANITLTNPGGLGTVASVPRLMPGQGTIVATGAIGYPPGLAQVDPPKLEELGVSKVMTMTSTYDHRVIQGAESGSFLRRIDELLQGADGFYEAILESLGIGAPAPEPAAASTASPVTEVMRVPAGARPEPEPDISLLQGVQASNALVKAHRTFGHLAARLDPLGSEPVSDPALDPATVGLTSELMRRIPASILRVAVPGETFAEALPRLRETYTGTIAYEIEHISDHDERVWLRQAIETRAFRTPLESDEKRGLLERLSEVEALETYLHKAFLGRKQFSIEGLDALVPMLDEAIELSVRAGAREVVLGMAHRGRLNVLAHTVGRPYESILVEFEGEQMLAEGTAAPVGGTGDVKYHYGASGTYETRDARQVTVTLSPNPSHLEYVNPVIEGRARADQANREGAQLRHDPNAVVPVLIHGDAAFTGQGVVAETLNLQGLDGYSTGGTLHVIANNQLGFTTDPGQERSTRYASDLAKGFDIPIIHVNADDVEACVSAVRLAMAFREQFNRDALIDLIGYRRFGHNEQDEPAYTHPLMYELIKRHPPVRKVYADRLAGEGLVSAEEAGRIAADAYARVAEAHERLKSSLGTLEEPDDETPEIDREAPSEPSTTVPADTLRALNEELLRVPEGFTVHRKLRPFLERRRKALVAGPSEGDADDSAGAPIDWAHAEALAFASLVATGVPVRLTGQDTERGTFSQRHGVLHDAKTGERHCPLAHLEQATAPFELFNSPLSEQACVGFEYGYSVQAPDALVLWEAQFGDFVNSAQVIVDQFMVSGLAKWGQTSRLTLLLPHGYEGSGPEHSSARIERFLQAAAEGNIRVANCTTPAQYFHLLRLQALIPRPRPLVLMTPKSLLRLPAASSRLEELSEGGFQRVIDDPRFARGHTPRERVTKLVLCSGKVYYDIVAHEAREAADHVAVARVELLYPFPEAEITELMDSYPSLERVVWVQEEPRNMGPRGFMRRRMAAILPEHLSYYYVGRQLRASPGEGYAAAHKKEQARIVRVALDLEEDVRAPDHSAQRPYLGRRA